MNLQATPEIVSGLEQLLASKKFAEDDFYPGAPTEEIRSSCESRVNEFITDLIRLLRSGTARHQVLFRARSLLQSFDEEDTEEREKVDDYIGDTMVILAIADWTEHL